MYTGVLPVYTAWGSDPLELELQTVVLSLEGRVHWDRKRQASLIVRILLPIKILKPCWMEDNLEKAQDSNELHTVNHTGMLALFHFLHKQWCEGNRRDRFQSQAHLHSLLVHQFTGWKTAFFFFLNWWGLIMLLGRIKLLIPASASQVTELLLCSATPRPVLALMLINVTGVMGIIVLVGLFQ